MGALLLDTVIEQGAAWQREFTAAQLGAAFPLTGFTLSGGVCNARGLVLASFAFTVNANKVLAELTNEQTALLAPAAKFTNNTYFVKAVSPGGIGYRIAKGIATISAEKQ